MALRYFDDVSSAISRATQIYPILIGAAHNRQILTYGKLADLLGFGGAGVFAQQLDHIMHWCAENGLPSLTALVVNQKTGLPGEGLWRADNLNAEREKIFAYPWFKLIPPTVEELTIAHEKRR